MVSVAARAYASLPKRIGTVRLGITSQAQATGILGETPVFTGRW
jgi:hypothetical protein